MNGKMKGSLIRKKARDIVRQFTIALNWKKLSMSQLVYVNNKCLLPKISYILQLSKLPIKAFNSIHQPYIRMIKHKLDITQKAGNYIVLHKGLLGCKTLAQEIVAKQVTGLQKRLNTKGNQRKPNRAYHLKSKTRFSGCMYNKGH